MSAHAVISHENLAVKTFKKWTLHPVWRSGKIQETACLKSAPKGRTLKTSLIFFLDPLDSF